MKQEADNARRRVVLVSGLSGGGKASALHILEDLGYEAVDNMPLPMIETLVEGAQRNLAVGVDIRTSGFNIKTVLAMLAGLRADPRRRAELMYLFADEATLLRRYTETRRRHPMAPQGRVSDGISGEIAQTDALREAADLAIDTSGLPLAALRQLIEGHFGAASAPNAPALVVTLISFAYPQGLPKDADLVFDGRFLRNPHYDPLLRPHTGLDADVGDYVSADPDYGQFFKYLTQMLGLLLPRFVQEGKKYATIAIGCTGGRHRSVYLVEQLSRQLVGQIASRRLPWRLHVSHLELAREGLSAAYLSNRSVVEPARDPRETAEHASEAAEHVSEAAEQTREASRSDTLDMPGKTAHEGP
jgi:UPF0042 nucleotide-binding protein